MTHDSIQIWNNVHSSREWGTCPETSVARWALKRWRSDVTEYPLSIRILDVGCGIGAQAQWLGQAGFMVDGFDASESAIKRANHRNAFPHAVNYDVGVVPGDLYDLPSWQYDGVVDVCTLQHVEQLDYTVRQLHRVLKDGGHLLSIMATQVHDPLPCEKDGGELDGALFRRVNMQQVRQIFEPVFTGGVRIFTKSYNDEGDGVMVCHWVVHAQK